MIRRPVDQRRSGFTLLELMLSLTITAMVGAAIAGMLGAVSSGVFTRDDSRSVMIRAAAAQSRLSAYVVPALAMLHQAGDELVLWQDDARESGTVHASEIRWLRYDGVEDVLEVHYLRFPDDWTQTAIDLADREYAVNSDWSLIYSFYDDLGLIGSRRLVDGLTAVSIVIDETQPLDSRHVTYYLDVVTSAGADTVTVSATIRQHTAPVDP